MTIDVLPARAMRSFERAVELFGPDIRAIPLSIYDDAQYPYPAYTDSNGIHIGKSVIENEPHRLHVYFGHELLHHVIYDPLARSIFPPKLLNYCADLVINWILKTVFDLDVRKALHVGVYDAKLARNKTLLQVCNAYLKQRGVELENVHGSGCGHKHTITHPSIYKAASALMQQLRFHSALEHLDLGRPREIVLLPQEADQKMFQELRERSWRIHHHTHTPVDFDLLLRGLYGRLFSPVVRYDIRKDIPVLGYEHSIALTAAVARLRPMTRNDAAASLTAADLLIRNLLDWGTPVWKANLISKIQIRIDKMQEKIKLRNQYSKTERAGFKLKIQRSLARIEKIGREVPLSSLLTEENRVAARARSDRTTGSAIMDALTIKDDYLPRMTRTELSDFVRKVSRRSYKEIDLILTTAGKLKAFLDQQPKVDSVLEGEVDSPPLEREKIEEEQEQHVPVIRRKPVLSARMPEPDLEAKEESGKEESSSGEPGGSPAAATELTADDVLSDIENALASSEQKAPADGVGSGEGKPTAVANLESLNIVRNNVKMLSKILIEADFFEEKLARASKTRIDENSLIDSTFTYGDEIQRADTSGLVKLVDDVTRLSFFADVANHALLQHAGTSPRRGSFIINLDCSGSMAGDRFIIAAGFTLAMFKVLQDTQRGCALVKFASNVDGVYVCDKNVPVDFVRLLKSLTTPSLGGTNFDCAFEQSILIQETFGWSNTQMILVTDGGGSVSKPALDACAEKMRITGVVVGSRGNVPIKGIHDMKYINSIHDLRNGLVSLGRSML